MLCTLLDGSKETRSIKYIGWVFIQRFAAFSFCVEFSLQWSIWLRIILSVFCRGEVHVCNVLGWGKTSSSLLPCHGVDKLLPDFHLLCFFHRNHILLSVYRLFLYLFWSRYVLLWMSILAYYVSFAKKVVNWAWVIII